MTTFDEAAAAYAYGELTHARPLSEWHADMGPMLWWKLEEVKTSNGEVTGHRWAGEPPYVGSPLDCGREVMVNIEASIWTFPNKQVGKEQTNQFSRMVGGWPGYHTHFTPLPPIPKVPK